MTKELKNRILENKVLTYDERMEILKALEQQTSSEDCVSREQALLSLTGKNLNTKSADELIALFDKRIKALPPVTPTFPKGATNGDMIKAMFPYGKYGTNGNEVHVYGVGGNGCLVFTLDWWNTPYKRGAEND